MHRRNETTGLPVVVLSLFVLAILAGSVVLAGATNVYPPVTQGLHDFLLGKSNGGLLSTLIVTGADGKPIYQGTTLTRFASLQLPSGGLLYNATTGQGGEVIEELDANIVIQQGTPANYTIAGSTALVVDGVSRKQVPISISQAGAPPASVALPAVSRSGSELWGDFGGSVPASVTSHSVQFSTSGSATVCFIGAACETKTWQNSNIGGVTVNALPNPTGAFTVSVTPTPPTTITSGQLNKCPSGTYLDASNNCVPITQAPSTCGTPSTPPCAGGSVVAGTEILMADGSLRQVQDVEPGEAVMGFDVSTMSTSPSMVLSLRAIPASALYTFRTSAGTITSDGIQPFLVRNAQGKMQYVNGAVPASSLKVGDQIYAATLHEWVGITSVTVSHVPALVYDMQLSPLRYYLAGGFVVDDFKVLSGFVFCGDLAC
jgi:hypothetical protein